MCVKWWIFCAVCNRIEEMKYHTELQKAEYIFPTLMCDLRGRCAIRNFYVEMPTCCEMALHLTTHGWIESTAIDQSHRAAAVSSETQNEIDELLQSLTEGLPAGEITVMASEEANDEGEIDVEN